MTKYLIENRRSSKRFGITLPMIVRGSRASLPALTESVDFSVSGFFFSLSQPLSVGETLEVLTLLTSGARGCEPAFDVCIQATAEVVRIVSNRSASGFGIGCCIVNFSVLPASAWDQAIAQCGTEWNCSRN